MMKMFPVYVPPHDVVECVPEAALFAKVHCFLDAICLSASVEESSVVLSQCSSLQALVVLPGRTGLVKDFNVCLQSSLVCIECAVRTGEQNFTVDNLPVYIAEVILVA